MLLAKNYSYYMTCMFGNYNYLPKVIAITGAKRCGKDTLANYIASRYQYEKLKLADPLKACVCALFDFTAEQVEDDSKEIVDKRWSISPRQALQFFGTEVMQYKIQELLPAIDRSFVVKSMLNKMHPDKYYIISDMRFYHEYEEIAKHNPFIIRIDRPSNQEFDTHSTDCEYKDIPFHMNIVNDKDIHSMKKKFDTLLE